MQDDAMVPLRAKDLDPEKKHNEIESYIEYNRGPEYGLDTNDLQGSPSPNMEAVHTPATSSLPAEDSEPSNTTLSLTSGHKATKRVDIHLYFESAETKPFTDEATDVEDDWRAATDPCIEDRRESETQLNCRRNSS